ncbi:MAG: hypothetical protein DRP72_00350 [Candidatus Omnitrophota bacterium]|nr:MAG: hypothetical protein DRP72_00350 [Candidatus Omnitrophota bacterium]
MIQIINAIKWPSVVILALIIFRKPLSELILYIKAIKWGNFEATFGRKIKQLEKDANNLPYPIDVKVEKVSAFDTSDRYVQLAKIDPRSAFS